MAGMTAAAPCVLAIDLGTSGPKAAVVELSGRILATAHRSVDTLLLPDGGAEQDAEAVWSAVRSACGEALRSPGAAAADVRAVICSSQYSSIVPVDRDGRPTMNMLLWLDRRGETARLRRMPGFPPRTDTPWQLLTWLRIHGMPPVAGGISLTHMRWIKYARPDVYERTATFLEPMDYVTLRLSGRASANQCTAFMSLMTDNRNLQAMDYDPRLVRYSTLDRDKLPDLVAPGSTVGNVLPEVAAELGLSPQTRVVSGLNDTQCGGVGTCAFTGTHAAISVGSTSVMITHLAAKRTDVRHAILSMPSPVPETYFVMAENGTGGGTLEHFLGNLVYASDRFGELTARDRYALLQRTVDATPAGSGGVLFLPWLGGSLAPAADARMRGGFLNLGLATTRSQLARAVLEGVALNLRWLRPAVERFVKRRFSHFVFYGGGAESDAWSQIMSDVLGAPVHQLEHPRYATGRGAALLAFQALGMIGFDEFQARVPVRRVYEPNPAHGRLYADLSRQFIRAFRATRPIIHALSETEPGP